MCVWWHDCFLSSDSVLMIFRWFILFFFSSFLLTPNCHRQFCLPVQTALRSPRHSVLDCVSSCFGSIETQCVTKRIVAMYGVLQCCIGCESVGKAFTLITKMRRTPNKNPIIIFDLSLKSTRQHNMALGLTAAFTSTEFMCQIR